MLPIDWILLCLAIVSPVVTGAVTWGMMRVEIRFLIESRTDHERRLRKLEQTFWGGGLHESVDNKTTS